MFCTYEFSNTFSSYEIFDFRLKFQVLFPRFKSIIDQYWFWWWFSAEQPSSHYLKKWGTTQIIMPYVVTRPQRAKGNTTNLRHSGFYPGVVIIHHKSYNSSLTSIGSDNDLSPGQRQGSIWNNAGILLIGPFGTKISDILLETHTFLFINIHLKMSSGKWLPFCYGAFGIRK